MFKRKPLSGPGTVRPFIAWDRNKKVSRLYFLVETEEVVAPYRLMLLDEKSATNKFSTDINDFVPVTSQNSDRQHAVRSMRADLFNRRSGLAAPIEVVNDFAGTRMSIDAVGTFVPMDRELEVGIAYYGQGVILPSGDFDVTVFHDESGVELTEHLVKGPDQRERVFT